MREQKQVRTPAAWYLFVGIGCLIGMTGCQPIERGRDLAANGKAAEGSALDSETTDLNKPQVFAVSYPLEYLTQRIAGEMIDVTCPVPAAIEASHWHPTREAILKMQTAELIVANGTGAKFANWLDTVSLPSEKICYSATRGLSLSDYIPVADTVHAHGPQGEHSHASTVPYTWLDPAIAAKQAQFIAQDLIARFPQHAELFQQNLTELKQDLTELSQLLKPRMDSATGLARDPDPLPIIFTANSDLKFFTRAAGWEDHHLSWFEPPSSTVVAEVLKGLSEQRDAGRTVEVNGKTLLLSTFSMPEPLAGLFDSRQFTVVVIDRLDVRPTAGNYLDVMKANILAIQASRESE